MFGTDGWSESLSLPEEFEIVRISQLDWWLFEVEPVLIDTSLCGVLEWDEDARGGMVYSLKVHRSNSARIWSGAASLRVVGDVSRTE